MIDNYKANIKFILDEGQVEGFKLNNIDTLRKVFDDKDINKLLFKEFNNYFSYNFEDDDLLMKCQDLVYNVHSFVSDFLIDKHEIRDYEEIKDILSMAIENKADFYGAPNYNEYDKEVIEEYEDYYSEDIKI